LAVAADPPPLVLEQAQLGQAPRWTSPGAAGLPLSLKAPEQGRWVGSDGLELSAGEFLPPALSTEIRRRLSLLELYPDVCQVELDKLAEYKDLQAERALKVAEAEATVNRVAVQVDAAEDAGWDWTEIAIAVGGAVLAGVAGFGIGTTVRR